MSADPSPQDTPSTPSPAAAAPPSAEPAAEAGQPAAGVAPGAAPLAAPEGAAAAPAAGSADDGDDASEGEGDGAEGEGDTADAPGGAAGGQWENEGGSGAAAEGSAAGPTKRKRKRRRKKKAAGEGATTAEGAPPAEGAAEGAPREGGGPRGGGQGGGHQRARRDRPSTERAPFHVGEEVFGKVTAVLDTAIMVDLSGKALAIFDRGEMEPDDLVPAVGDRFVARIHNDGIRGGLVVLTRKPLRGDEALPRIEKAQAEGTLVQGLITGAIKGGVEVDLDGLRAFAPASGMDLHPSNAHFAALVGQRLDFKVLEVKGAGRDVVVTRRPMLEVEARDRRKQALSLLTEGQVLRGVVRTLTEWGAFVALPEAENLEGLVHVTEASHDPRASIADLFKRGDSFDVKIVKIDEQGKIWLSRKELLEDPWAEARTRFAQGTRHTGKVTRLEPFGVFVELEPGLDGLLHVADLTFERIEHPKELVKLGQELEVIVHRFDAQSRRLSLHPAPPAGRAPEEPQRLAKYGSVKVEVLKGDTAGLTVRVLGMTGRAARGFVPAGQTGTPRGTDLRKHFKTGSIIECKIIDLDPMRGEPKLSIKGLAEDEEKRAHKEYRQKLRAEGGFGTLGDLLAQKLRG